MIDEEYIGGAYETFQTQESMGGPYHSERPILTRRGRDDHPTTEAAKEKVRILKDRRMIRRDLTSKL